MCVACGTPFPGRDRLGFRAVCPDCGRDIHTCSNCAFYKPGAHYDCAETIQDPVTDKERANLCEWWRPAAVRSPTGAARPTDAARPVDAKGKPDARSAFEGLFKN